MNVTPELIADLKTIIARNRARYDLRDMRAGDSTSGAACTIQCDTLEALLTAVESPTGYRLTAKAIALLDGHEGQVPADRNVQELNRPSNLQPPRV